MGGQLNIQVKALELLKGEELDGGGLEGGSPLDVFGPLHSVGIGHQQHTKISVSVY